MDWQLFWALYTGAGNKNRPYPPGLISGVPYLSREEYVEEA